MRIGIGGATGGMEEREEEGPFVLAANEDSRSPRKLFLCMSISLYVYFCVSIFLCLFLCMSISLYVYFSVCLFLVVFFFCMSFSFCLSKSISLNYFFILLSSPSFQL